MIFYLFYNDAVIPTAYIKSGRLLPLTADGAEADIFHIFRTSNALPSFHENRIPVRPGASLGQAQRTRIGVSLLAAPPWAQFGPFQSFFCLTPFSSISNNLGNLLLARSQPKSAQQKQEEAFQQTPKSGPDFKSFAEPILARERTENQTLRGAED